MAKPKLYLKRNDRLLKCDKCNKQIDCPNYQRGRGCISIGSKE